MPPDFRPRLAPHVRRQIDRVTGTEMLLHPEGCVELSETAGAIVALCDGARDLDAIVARLAEDYDAPGAEIRGDVEACLEDLATRGLLSA